MKKIAQLSVFITFITISLWYGVKWIQYDDKFKIKHIVLMSKVTQQNKDTLLQVTRSNLNGNFFSLDINKLRTAIESLPWIKEVSIRKVWSNSIQIRLKEKQVSARWVNIENLNNKSPAGSWDKHSLLSKTGEIFTPELDSAQQAQYSQFSLFSGPENLAGTMVSKCSKVSEVLATIKYSLSNCILDQRRAWTLSILPQQMKANDEKQMIHLVLGKSETNELRHLLQTKKEESSELSKHKIVKKVQLFVSLYKQVLYKYKNNINRIDMRYTNGFAIAWKEDYQSNHIQGNT
ncbi:MAG: FtsQ-type POTRA domain-containing protein [Gammaproteobacteria bacterium]|nr:FtsQ-type POTRA domain-containing protein [Gammaproteobacteria bacterium]